MKRRPEEEMKNVIDKSIDKKIERLLEKNTYFHASFGDLNNIKELHSIVLSDPKTGSTSLANSIQCAIDSSHRKKNVIHMHTNQSCLFRLFPDFSTENIGIKQLVAYRNKFNQSKCFIATLYREPFSRGISHFFESLEDRLEEQSIDSCDVSSEMICNIFLTHYYTYLWSHHVHWQLSDYFNINLLDIPFDKEQGLGFLETDQFCFIVVRLDKLNSNQDTISSITNLEDFKLKRVNDMSERWYSNLYMDFKQSLRLPKAIIDITFWLEQPYFEYFFTKEESEELKKRTYEENGFVYLPDTMENLSSFHTCHDIPEYARRLAYLRKQSI